MGFRSQISFPAYLYYISKMAILETFAGFLKSNNKNTSRQGNQMIQRQISQSNTSASNYSNQNLHIDLDSSLQEEKPQDVVFQGMRLDKVCWFILYEIYLITLTCKRDYCYTAKEISHRLIKKGIKGASLRSVEAALQILQSILFFVRKTTRKYLPVWGKEKYKGAYREVTEAGLEFIKYRFSERARLKEERLKNGSAVLIAELNGQEPYSRMASEPVSKINLKDIRSNLDLSVRCSRDERFDFANACFEEYAAQMSNAQPYIEREALQEEIYQPVEPKYRPTVKKLLDESGLENERKQEVIQAVYRQQNCNTKIVSIAGVTKKFIAEARVRQRDKIQSNKNAAYKPFQFIDLTEEQAEASKKAKQIAFAEMRLKLN